MPAASVGEAIPEMMDPKTIKIRAKGGNKDRMSLGTSRSSFDGIVRRN